MLEGAVEVWYGEGWDPQARAVVGAISEAEARSRDTSGEKYAAVLAAQGRPKALFQVDWRHGYLGLFLFDGQLRRTREYEYRQLEPGRLHLRRFQEWRHAVDTEPEFPEDGWCFTLTTEPDGWALRELATDGCRTSPGRVPPEHRTVAKAEFGSWAAYVDGPMLGLDGPRVLVPASPPVTDVAPAGAPGWSAPQALRPRHVEALFVPGSRLADADGSVAVIGEPAHAGVLHLPTGRVVAADPYLLGGDEAAFTVTVPPGDYPVLIASLRWEEGGWDGSVPAAAMLRILDRPTATWEMALRPGDDIRLLGDGEFHGFGVDTGTACFLDASGRDGLFAIVQQKDELWETGSAPFAEISDPVNGTNLIAYSSGMGDGSYPVWIGRDADGEVTCFVADMLVLDDAEALPPTVTSTATCLSSNPPVADDFRGAPFTSPSATADFLAAQIADVECQQDTHTRQVTRAPIGSSPIWTI